MKNRKQEPNRVTDLRIIPPLQDILNHSILLSTGIDKKYLKTIADREIDSFRNLLRQGKTDAGLKRDDALQIIVKASLKKIQQLQQNQLRRVINGTGIILHTNLGRAPLSEAAREHVHEVLENYCNLEIDLESGKRGERHSLVEEIICLITGAEAAVVVNNNAAAILLALNSLAYRKEVPVSRGELVEIGGSFRMPEVMKSGNVKMVEVGTTNKTHLKDYENAISSRTGCLLKVHTSNYRVLGFTSSVKIPDLADLAHLHDVPLIYDMGSGVLEDVARWGYSREPVAREVVEGGADVVTFSADKVLGGPQAGIIIGKKKYLQKIRKNHLLRALRCDKLTYSALEATLRIYLAPEKLPESLPVAVMLKVTVSELHRRAGEFAEMLDGLPLEIQISNTFSQMGSGALPLERIPSLAVSIKPRKMSVNSFARRMRQQEPPVVGYIEDDFFRLNFRTIRPDEIPVIAEKIRKILSGK